MLLAARALTGVAAVKVLWMVLAVALGTSVAPADPEGLAFGVYPTAMLAVAFAASGGFLIWASPSDTRGWWLGGTLLLVGVAFGDAVLLRRTLTGLEASVTSALTVDAFLPFFLWSFLRDFPRLETAASDRLAAWCVRVSAGVGVALVAANLFLQLGADASSQALLPYLARRNDSAYPMLVMGLTAAGLPYLLWKSQQARVSEKRRVQIFAAGLMAAGGPILLDILLSSVSPAYDAFTSARGAVDVRVLLFVTLALVPLVTVYSVLVDRVIDVRVVLRNALQYAMAKYTLFALVSVPFVLLAAHVFAHRDEPLANLFVGPRFAFSLTLMAAGAAALSQRSRWLRAIDRRFFRDESDAAVLIVSLADHARAAVDELELARIVRRDVAEGLHVEHAALLVGSAARGSFTDPDARLQPLGYASGIVLLLSGDSAPFDVSPAPDNPVFNRLPPQERRWLAEGGFEVLVPIRKSRSALAAVLALGPKRSGQRFSAADHRVLAAVGASLTLAIENQRLKSSPSGDDEEPAEECLTCGVLYPSGSAGCRCGGGQPARRCHTFCATPSDSSGGWARAAWAWSTRRWIWRSRVRWPSRHYRDCLRAVPNGCATRPRRWRGWRIRIWPPSMGRRHGVARRCSWWSSSPGGRLQIGCRPARSHWRTRAMWAWRLPTCCATSTARTWCTATSNLATSGSRPQARSSCWISVWPGCSPTASFRPSTSGGRAWPIWPQRIRPVTCRARTR